MRYVEGSDLKKLLADGTVARRAGDRDRLAGRRRRSTPPTSAGSSTATSSPRTCCSTSMGTSTSPTSASPGGSASRGPARARGCRSGTIDYVAPEQIRGRGGRRPRRPVLARLPPLRVPDRRAALRRAPSDAADAVRPPRGGAAGAAGARGRACQGAGEGARRPLRDVQRARRGCAQGAGNRRAAAQPLARSPSPRVGLALIAAALLAFFLTRGGGASDRRHGRAPAPDRPSASNGSPTSSRSATSPGAVAVGQRARLGRLVLATARCGRSTRRPGGHDQDRRVGAALRPGRRTAAYAYVAAPGPASSPATSTQFDAVDRRPMPAASAAARLQPRGRHRYGVWVAGCPTCSS